MTATVGRICVREVDLVDAEESAWCAAERMHQRAVGTLVIINAAGHPVGIITDRDLVERVMATSRDPHTTRVAEVMTISPQTIGEQEAVGAALARMRQGRFRRLPVVDREGRLVGLLSLDDVLMLLAEQFAQIGGLLERETPASVVTGRHDE
jgi:CBS domain-containing protein